ncbi:MAG TPA: CHAP domain-containing protein, partial [Kofleriaceae bacterium]|nr:CHAP domain-containing protein [Kofleriaceae bacterium]
PASGNATTPATAGSEQAAGNAADQPAASANPVRASIVAAARAKIGSVFSDLPGGPDETGDQTRKGWETLTEIFDVAYPSFPKKIVKYMKYGKNGGGPDSNPNGLPSWCGIFATYAVITGGGNAGTWTSGNRVSAMNKVTNDPKPGDVGYFDAHQHHCIIAAVDGDRIETIDGNSFDGDTGGSGAITSKWRSRGDFRAFFKQVAD